MFHQTLKNHEPVEMRNYNWVKFSNATPENLSTVYKIEKTSTTPVITQSTSSQKAEVKATPRKITISKVSSAKTQKSSRIDSFKCKECNIMFLSFELHEKHMRNKHNLISTVNRFRCVKCKASFPSKHGLHVHLMKHERETPKSFKCSICEISFETNFRLQDHLSMHLESEKKFACKQCDRKFLRGDVLNQHIKIFHSKSTNVFKCGVCDYETNVKQNFEKHEGMHLRFAEKIRTKKFFSCDECAQSFREESVLKAHKSFVH